MATIRLGIDGTAHALGVRVRDLPPTPDRIVAAMDAGTTDQRPR
jgi:hypothetical protein